MTSTTPLTPDPEEQPQQPQQPPQEQQEPTVPFTTRDDLASLPSSWSPYPFSSPSSSNPSRPDGGATGAGARSSRGGKPDLDALAKRVARDDPHNGEDPDEVWACKGPEDIIDHSFGPIYTPDGKQTNIQGFKQHRVYASESQDGRHRTFTFEMPISHIHLMRIPWRATTRKLLALRYQWGNE